MSDVTVQPRRGLGPPIKGPTALGNDPRRLLRLTWALAVTDFALRFFGSALGYLWSFVQPLMLFGVLYIVFSVLLNFSGDERFYAVALLLGIVMYSFLNEATGGAVRSLVNRENLVRKIEFPRLAVPMATVLTACFNLGLNLLPVTIFLIASGGVPRWAWLEMPLIFAVLIAWAAGIAMLLSALFVRYRDIEPIWNVVLQIDLLRHADLLHRVARAREGQRGGRAADDAQPVRGHAPAGAPRASSTPRTRAWVRRWAGVAVDSCCRSSSPSPLASPDTSSSRARRRASPRSSRPARRRAVSRRRARRRTGR